MKNFLPLLFAASMGVLVSHPASAAPLDGLRGEKRPLLLFAKSRSDASFDKQVDLLRGVRPELQDRDMVVLRTTGSEETRAVIGYTPINRGTARLLKKQFEPASHGLTVILIGKDGTEKARWRRVVDPQEIFDLIDSMPMRKQEMKQQAEG